MTIAEVEKLALLARIEMSQAEKEEFLGSLESILRYIGQIQEVAVGEAHPEAGLLHNVLREDTDPMPSGIFTDKMLKLAPETQDGYIKVKQIL